MYECIKLNFPNCKKWLWLKKYQVYFEPNFIDLFFSFIYWTTYLDKPLGAVYKATLDGGNETIVIDNMKFPTGLAIDEEGEENGKNYFMSRDMILCI